MKRLKKIFKITLIVLTSILLTIIIALTIVSFTAYKPLGDMYDAIEVLDTSLIDVSESFDSYKIMVTNPKAQITMIPGGLVHTESYLYLAYNLALRGYNVTLSKALFHLAILTPNYASRFLSKNLPNIIIGHSLGGTVGGLITSNNKNVDHLILLASYTTTSIKDTSVLLITAENDLVINQSAFDKALNHYSNYKHIELSGGNHAGFGWYGKQSGDGISTFTIYEQQQLVIQAILEYLA